MENDSAQGEDETGNINLGDIPEDINVDPLQGQVPLYALPEFLWAASEDRNRPPARSVAGASITSRGSAAVFGRATRRTLDEIIQDKVIVRKGNWGVPSFKDFHVQSDSGYPGSSSQVPWVFPSAIKECSWKKQPKGQTYTRSVCVKFGCRKEACGVS
jgi:hypothetical protein